MKKNFILLIIVLFTLVGCDAKYEVELKNKKIVEKDSLIIDKDSVIDDSIYFTIDKMASKYFLSTDFLLGGEKKEYYEDDKAIYQKINKMDLNEYNNSDIFGYCYSAHNVVIEDDYVLITTSNSFNCFDRYSELENVDIVFKSNHKLIETNADEVGKYTYTWHINKENAANKKIYIKLYSDKYVFNYNHEFTKKVCIVVGIVAVILLIVLILIKKHKKASKF